MDASDYQKTPNVIQHEYSGFIITRKRRYKKPNHA